MVIGWQPPETEAEGWPEEGDKNMSENVFVRDGRDLMPQIAQNHGNADCPIVLHVRDLSFQPYQGDRAYDVKTNENKTSYAVRCVGYRMRVTDDEDGHAQFARLAQCDGCALHTAAAFHTADLKPINPELHSDTLIMNLHEPWVLYRGGQALPIIKLNPVDRNFAIGFIQQFHRNTIDKANPTYTQALIQTFLEKNVRTAFATTYDLITAADKNPLSQKGMKELVTEMELRVTDSIKLLLSLQPETLGDFFRHPNIKINVDWDFFHGFLHRQLTVDKAVIFGWPPKHWLPDDKEGKLFVTQLNPELREQAIAFYRDNL